MDDIDLETAEALVKESLIEELKVQSPVINNDNKSQEPHPESIKSDIENRNSEIVEDAKDESKIELETDEHIEKGKKSKSKSARKDKKIKKEKHKKKKEKKRKEKERHEKGKDRDGKDKDAEKEIEQEKELIKDSNSRKENREKKKKHSHTRSKDKKREKTSPQRKKSRSREERHEKKVIEPPANQKRRRTRSLSNERLKKEKGEIKVSQRKGDDERRSKEKRDIKDKKGNEIHIDKHDEKKSGKTEIEHKNGGGENKKKDEFYNPRFDPQYYQVSFEDTLEDKQKFELQILENSLLEARINIFSNLEKSAEDTKRDDCTILVLYLPVRASEIEVYGFFKKCGRIRDIKIIKDPKTEISKGIAYIEFYSHEGVLKAMSMSGHDIEGHTIKVMPSGAEKNRAAAAAKQLKSTQSKPIIELPGTTPQFNPSAPSMKVYVMGLIETLATFGELDLRDLFSPFGDIDFIELPKDPINNKNVGYATIQYRHAGDARAAINKMNGLVIRNKPISVSAYCNIPGVVEQHPANETELDDEVFIRTSQSRTVLMQKLMREPGISTQAVQTAITPRNDPSSVLLLTDMFTTTDIRSKDSSFFTDLRDEINEECMKYGKVEKVIVDIQSDGYVWIKFAEVDAAKKTHHFLNQRVISGRRLQSFYIPESQFYLRFENEN